MTEAELIALAEKMLKLPTAQKLTIAAMLLQRDRVDVAETVIKAALEDLQARRLLGFERAPLVTAQSAPAVPNRTNNPRPITREK